jgi:hypothetical protein
MDRHGRLHRSRAGRSLKKHQTFHLPDLREEERMRKESEGQLIEGSPRERWAGRGQLICLARLTEGFDALDLKEAKALLEEL